MLNISNKKPAFLMAGNKLVTKQMKNCLLRASLKAKIEIILVLIIILNCYFVFPFFQ